MKNAGMKTLLLVLSSAFFFSCVIAPTPKNPFSTYSFEGASYQPKVDHFLVILDASSSMGEKFKDNAKLNIAKNFLDAMNHSIPDIRLDGALRNFGPGPLFFSGQNKLLYGLTSYTRHEFDKALKTIQYASGYSPLSAAVDAAKDDLKDAEGKIAVIVVSDGKDIDNSPVKSAAAMKARFGERLCITTVLVGDDSGGEKLLQNVAKAGKCGFSFLSDSFTTKAGMGEFVKKVFLTMDSDGDGVFDRFDKCPNTIKDFKVDPNGCLLDKDGDGVPDYKDDCPETPKGIKVNGSGCPLDSDFDGVYDYKDNCPETPDGAKVDAAGCWALKGVQFDTGKSMIKKVYFPVLDEAVDVLEKNSKLKIEVQGHTDERGSRMYNQKLSEARAKSVAEYLKRAGIEADRVSHAGYGFLRPIASNATREGRAQNRRVNLKPIR